MRSNRAADVGAHDHAHRLGQGHDARGDKADHQHRGDRGGIENSGNHRPGQCAEEAVDSELLQHRLQGAPGGLFQPVGEYFQAGQEQGQSTEQPHPQL